MKKCVICGAEFEPYYCKGDRQKTCASKECRKKYQINYEKQCRDIINARRKKYYKRREHLCKICGNPTELDKLYNSFSMHEECVINDCVKTYKETGRLTRAQEERLYRRGFSVKEFKEEFVNGV